MSTPGVSVIIPVYNAEQFISECLESVINQTYAPLQIIVAIDLGVDDSVEIVREFQSKHPQLIDVIEHKERVGIPTNFNSALYKVNQPYVSFVAGDDLWHPDKLRNEIKLLKKDVDCVYSSCALIDSEGKRISSFKRKYDGDQGNVLFQMLMHDMAFRNPLLKMDIVREIGYYNENLEIFEDWQFKIEYLAKVKVAFSPEETIFYRQHESGISKRSNALTYYKCLKEVYSSVNHIIHTLDKKQKKQVLERAKHDLLTNLIKGINDNNISVLNKLYICKELFKLNPKLAIKKIIFA